MRLTLRTLLAWKDGLLQGAERDELGAKVAASTVAPLLVERITELASRTDLAAPHADAQRLAREANTVAEFLDNVLPADQLEAFERVCLESEMHLADVADCHSLLAEVMRDASCVAPLEQAFSMQLLDVIAQHAPQTHDGSQADTIAAIGDVMREAKAAAGRSTPASAKHRDRASLGAWLSAGAAVALLVVLGGFLITSIWPPSARSRQVAVSDQKGDTLPPRAAAPAETTPPDAMEEVQPDERADMAAAVDESVDAEPDSPAVAEPPSPPDQPPTPLPQPADEVVIPLPLMEIDEDEPPEVDPAPMAPVAPPQPRDAGRVVAGGQLLHRVAVGNDSGWRAIGPGVSLAESEEFIVPVHCYPEIVRGNVSIRLLPRSRGAVTADRDGTLRLEIVFGEAVVWSEAVDAKVGITAGGLSGVFSLGPRQPVGIEVALTRERGADPAVVPPGMRATIVAPGGGRWRQTESDGELAGSPLAGLGIDQPLPPRHALAWDSAAAGAARIMPIAQEPRWMNLTGPTQPLDRLAAVALATALAADVPANQSLRLLAESRRVEDRMAAAATLSLLGDYDPLVEALCDESQARQLRDGEWTTLEVMTVPLAIARGANSAAALRQSFARCGPPGRDAELFLVARGLTADEWAGGGAAGLVASLEDSTLVVRRYALANLVALLPDPAEATRDYRPERPMRLNDKGIAWWRARLAAGELRGEGEP